MNTPNNGSAMQGIITGAAGNIGRATAHRLARAGARILLVDRDEGPLSALQSELQSTHGATAHVRAADVTDPRSVSDFCEFAASKLGSIDFMFANAGIEGPVVPAHEYPDDGFDAVMRVNTAGVFLCVKYAIPHMRAGGSVVLTSSIMGLKGGPNTIGYTASKHAVVGLMRSFAKNLASKRIRVNCVHPGFVDSDMLKRIETELSSRGASDPRAAAIAATPMGECVSPDDIAAAVEFLLGSGSRFITGQTLAIDGGYLL